MGEGNSLCKGCRVERSSGFQGTKDRPVSSGMWGAGVSSRKSFRGGRPDWVALGTMVNGVGFIPSALELIQGIAPRRESLGN